MVFDSLLNTTFSHYRRTRTSTGSGGWTIGYTQVADFLGRIRPVEGKEQEIAESVERRITHVLYTKPDLDIRRGDKIEDTSREFEILAIREPSEHGHHLEIDCEEIQRELIDATRS